MKLKEEGPVGRSSSAPFFWGGGCLAGPATLTHHVWLRGSQVSLPTLSMQNFWGPLLPDGEEQRRKCTGPICRTGCLTPQMGPAFPLPSVGGRLTNELCESPDRQAAGPCHKLQKPDSLLVVHLLDHLQPPGERGEGRSLDQSWATFPPGCGLPQRLQGLQSPPGPSGCPPARTTGSACCSWCNACRWCSSASRSGQFPACHTASAGEEAATDPVCPSLSLTAWLAQQASLAAQDHNSLTEEAADA